jgi:hypothetical protein
MDDELIFGGLHDTQAFLNILFKLMNEDELQMRQIFAVMRQMDVLLFTIRKELEEMAGGLLNHDENFQDHIVKQIEKLEEEEK